jgi:hypothetical protein
MKLGQTLVPAMVAIAASACFNDPTTRERELTRSYKVAPGSVVVIDVAGSDVSVITGESGVVNLSLKQEVRARSDREADSTIARYDVALAQERDTVTLKARRKSGDSWGWDGHVSFSAVAEVPANVRLDVRTSGGRIRVGGDRAAAIKLRTSGGSVRADGGAADMDIASQGGEIVVQRALGALSARATGGSIDVRYLSVARDAELTSSGGSIDVRVARNAAFVFDGRSTGGNIDIRDLTQTDAADDHADRDRERDRERKVVINGGGARRLVARSTGGNIRVSGTDEEN